MAEKARKRGEEVPEAGRRILIIADRTASLPAVWTVDDYTARHWKAIRREHHILAWRYWDPPAWIDGGEGGRDAAIDTP